MVITLTFPGFHSISYQIISYVIPHAGGTLLVVNLLMNNSITKLSHILLGRFFFYHFNLYFEIEFYVTFMHCLD